MEKALEELRETVKGMLDTSPRCHDWDHTGRVRAVARHLAEAEGADLRVVEFAALLHDIGRAEEIKVKGKSCHARDGAERVPELLRSAGIDDEAFIRHVADCVLTHRYRRREERQPATIEAMVVFDADKLDSMGAIGVGRAFHFAGNIGARVHNTEEEALGSDAYGHEDSAYREYLVKLRHLHDAMLTAEGRRMGEERHRFMREFFERLGREVAGLGRGGERREDSPRKSSENSEKEGEGI